MKQIAQDIYAKLIFSTGHIQNPGDVQTVFMVLNFISGKDLAVLDKKEAFIYEYINKAFSCSINGLPCFPSFQYLDKEETEKMNEYYQKIKQAVNTALEC